MDGKTSTIINKPFYKKIWFFILVILLLTVLTCWTILQVLFPTTSPITTTSYFLYSIQHPHISMRKETLAFMPYWRLSDSIYTRLDLLSEINYFSLNIDKDGNFIKIVDNQTDPGWLAWNGQIVKDIIAKTQVTGGKFSLTVASQENKTSESLLKNLSAQEVFIKNIIDQVTQRHLNGIIIDFEYNGAPDDISVNNFTQFAKNLSQTMHKKTPNVSLSLTLLPLAQREKGLFDLPRILPYFDRFIGMSYDYYAQGSDIAGPVAPMSGFSQNKFFFDVVTTYEDYEKYIPKDKIIMGIPYYGYDWAVKDAKKIQSPTLPQKDPNNYSAVISYGRMREDKDLNPTQCNWDDFAKEPWCWYIDDKKINHQVWFENNKSIKIKYDFAKTQQFGGVAIWAMGYDKSYSDLWNIMENTFKR